MSTPVISIFMPVYNGERFLAPALESLLDQSYGDFEIVVVDDGSNDRTHEIAADLAMKDRRIRVVTHDHNRGLSAARNTGWSSVSPDSEFIMNHDSDDISLPKKLERLIGYLAKNPRLSAAGSFCRYINEQGEPLYIPPMECSSSAIRQTFGDLNSMAISATLVRRKLYEEVAPFRAGFGGCDDYDFWARALVAGFELANIPEVLHHIRIHTSSMGATQTAEMAAHARAIAGWYSVHIGNDAASLLKRRMLSISRSARVQTRLLLNSIKKNS